VGSQIINPESAPFSCNFQGTNIKVFVGSQIINLASAPFVGTLVGIPNFFVEIVGTLVGIPNFFVGIVGIVFLCKLYPNLNLYLILAEIVAHFEQFQQFQ
jgi:hypothetical protein